MAYSFVLGIRGLVNRVNGFLLLLDLGVSFLFLIYYAVWVILSIWGSGVCLIESVAVIVPRTNTKNSKFQETVRQMIWWSERSVFRRNAGSVTSLMWQE